MRRLAAAAVHMLPAVASFQRRIEMTSYSAAAHHPTTSSELSHASIGQWGGVIAGILGGFAATVVLATLGSAMGLTAGVAASASDANANDAATGITVAAIVWLVISAILVGLTGGTILARSSRPDRSYSPGTLGLITWAGGIVLAVVLAAPTALGVMSGIGGASANPELRNQVGTAMASRDGTTANPAGVPADANYRASSLTTAEQARTMAENAARAVTLAAWAALAAQLLSLGATVMAASWQRKKVLGSNADGYAAEPVRVSP